MSLLSRFRKKNEVDRHPAEEAEPEERYAKDAPEPDDPRKPASPMDLQKRSWGYVGRKVMREFSADQGTDLAAALTYYSVLALFPGAIALFSLLGVLGQGQQTADEVVKVVGQVAPQSVVDSLQPTIESFATSPGAGFALVVGILGALWSASGYVGAFSRAMNRVYEIEEGRPIWKLRPVMLVVTLVAVVLCALALLALVLTGPVAEAVGDFIGLGDTAVLVWQIAKWPVLLVVVVVIVAILYYATPNVKQPKFRWISVGALVAILSWVLLSAAFGVYLATFASYSKTYGSLAGAVIFLLWLWLTNIALLLGAEIDAELERTRELQAGLPAEEQIQLPPRDTRNIEKAAEKELEDVEAGRAIREHAAAEAEKDAHRESRRRE